MTRSVSSISPTDEFRCGPGVEGDLEYVRRGPLGLYHNPGRELRPRFLQTLDTLNLCSDPELLFRVVRHGDRTVGYIIWDLAGRARLSNEPLALVWQLAVEPDYPFSPVAEALLEHSRLPPERPPAVTVPVEQKEVTAFLKTRGFLAANDIIGRPIETHNLETSLQKGFQMRRGRETDRTFLKLVAGNNLVHTLPPRGRQADYQKAVLEGIDELDFDDRETTAVFVLRDRASRRSAGFIIYDLEPDGVAYLRDVSVKRAYWGRYAAQHLVRAGENELGALGFTFVYADVSAANRRSFLTARRSLGFAHLARMWRLPLS